MKKPNLGDDLFVENAMAFSTDGTALAKAAAKALPKNTGRHILVLKNGAGDLSKVRQAAQQKAGMKTASTQDFSLDTFTEDALGDAEVLIYEDMGIALIGGEEQQVKLMKDNLHEADLLPENIVYVPDQFQAGNLVQNAAGWGINKVRANMSTYTGKDVKVAVLDTGMDLNHPDFTGRTINHTTFVPNEGVQDLYGHGTHCIGTACGYKDHAGVRYGIAYESDIYVAKVLSNQGRGAQSWILSGINWAVNQGCHVISMSLGSSGNPGGYNAAYEAAFKYGRSKGSIFVVAAGNESNRPGTIRRISSPADCPSALAIAALEDLPPLGIGYFSNGSVPPTAIEVAAPGVSIYSSWPMPARYHTISGTSMATPHVAGILALFWQKHPNFNNSQIINAFRNLVQTLPLPASDVGRGLSIAP